MGHDGGRHESNQIALALSTFVIPYMNEQVEWFVFRPTFTEKSHAWWIASMLGFLAGFVIFAALGKSREILAHLVRLFGA